MRRRATILVMKHRGPVFIKMYGLLGNPRRVYIGNVGIWIFRVESFSLILSLEIVSWIFISIFIEFLWMDHRYSGTREP